MYNHTQECWPHLQESVLNTNTTPYRWKIERKYSLTFHTSQVIKKTKVQTDMNTPVSKEKSDYITFRDEIAYFLVLLSKVIIFSRI